MKKSKKKTSVLPKIEFVVIAVFFFSFLMWASSKCRVTQEKYALNQLSISNSTNADSESDAPSEPAETLLSENPQTATAPKQMQSASKPFYGISRDSLAKIYNAIAQGADPKSFLDHQSFSTPAKVVVVDTVIERTKLYVVIEGLNFRMAPSLESPAVLRLQKGHELQFLGEVSPFTQEINMGEYVANEPWIKVRHWKGQTGWVYGAGVNYFMPPDTNTVISLTANP